MSDNKAWIDDNERPIKPVVALNIFAETIDKLKSQYNDRYGQLGVFDALEKQKLI